MVNGKRKFFIFSNTRFAIDSMQSSCLDKVGGEKTADQQIQETSFIQHTFGGHLRSQANTLFIYFDEKKTWLYIVHLSAFMAKIYSFVLFLVFYDPGKVYEV